MVELHDPEVSSNQTDSMILWTESGPSFDTHPEIFPSHSSYSGLCSGFASLLAFVSLRLGLKGDIASSHIWSPPCCFAGHQAGFIYFCMWGSIHSKRAVQKGLMSPVPCQGFGLRGKRSIFKIGGVTWIHSVTPKGWSVVFPAQALTQRKFRLESHTRHFSKTQHIRNWKENQVHVLHLVNRHFPMKNILSKPAVGSTSQGIIPGTTNVCSTQPGLRGINLFSSNGVSALSCEILIHGNPVHCQVILPSVCCGLSLSLHYCISAS